MAQRRLLFFCLPLTVLFVFTRTQAQAPSPFKNLATSINTPVLDTVSGSGLDVNLSNPQPKHGHLSVNIIGVGGAEMPYVYELQYIPDPGFVGVDTFMLEYRYATAFPFLTYRGFRVSVGHSMVTTRDDHATTAMNTPVAIPVLANDHADWGPLAIEAVPVVNGGTAWVDADQQIVFTPKPGYTGLAHINYVVCDALHTCKTASVNIGVYGNTPDDTPLEIYTDKNNPVAVPLQYEGYSLESNPKYGQVTLENGNFFTYQPNQDFAGTDEFTLRTMVDGVAYLKTVTAKVFNTPAANKMAMDDVRYTAEGQAITFNVRDNDLGNLQVRGWHTPANFPGTLSNTTSSGTVTFTPNPGFKGIATFTYKLGSAWAPTLETATVNIVVDNFAPPVKFPYPLRTPKNVPFVVRYEPPFQHFSFEIQHQPQFGALEYFPGNSTQIINGESVSGYNLVVYTPRPGFVGLDQLSMLYCAPNGQCDQVNIDMRVVDEVPDFCVGECVWPGDVNADRLVNNQDLLPLGYVMGEEGLERPDASRNWYAQAAPAWNDCYHGMKSDLKYADADGNGIIDTADVGVIRKNYGLASNLFPQQYPLDKGLPFSVSLMPPDPDNDRHIRIQVSLGNDQVPASQVYGITFNATLGPGIVDSAFKMTFYDNSWLNRNSPWLQLAERPAPGHFETAFTRTSGKPASGQGPIGEMEFIIIIVEGGGQNNRPAALTLNPTIQFVDGSSTTGEPITLLLPEMRTSSKPEYAMQEDNHISVFPSPASDKLSVHWEFSEPVERLALVDMEGRLMLEQSTAESATDALLDVQKLPSGMYVLQLQTASGLVSKKVEISH